MFYANLGVIYGKLSVFLMNKRIVLDVQTLAKLFKMDGSAPCKLAKDFQEFNREEAIKLLFPYYKPSKAS